MEYLQLIYNTTNRMVISSSKSTMDFGSNIHRELVTDEAVLNLNYTDDNTIIDQIYDATTGEALLYQYKVTFDAELQLNGIEVVKTIAQYNSENPSTPVMSEVDTLRAELNLFKMQVDLGMSLSN